MLRKSGGVAVAVAALAMCGSAVAARDVSGGSLPVVKVALDGHSVTIPSTVPAGAVTVQVTTTGEKAGDLALVRLQPGVTIAQAFAAVQSHHNDPNALQGLASIVADSLAPKGVTSTFSTTLQAGDYAALDLNAKGRPPVGTFTVTASGTAAALPKPSATIAAIDFGFTGPKTIHAGSIVRFVNDGYVAHMFIGIQVKNVAAARQAMALLKAGQDGKAQKLATGFADFMDTVSPGGMQQETITDKPGVYVLACFMGTEDGREHTVLGMERMLKIVR